MAFRTFPYSWNNHDMSLLKLYNKTFLITSALPGNPDIPPWSYNAAGLSRTLGVCMTARLHRWWQTHPGTQLPGALPRSNPILDAAEPVVENYCVLFVH